MVTFYKIHMVGGFPKVVKKVMVLKSVFLGITLGKLPTHHRNLSEELGKNLEDFCEFRAASPLGQKNLG